MTKPACLFSPAPAEKPFWLWILLIGIVFISAILYLPQQSLYFSQNDDIVILYRAMLNTWRIQVSPLALLDSFNRDYYPLLGGRPEKYRPIHNLAALILFPIFNGHPLGYHIFALMLHIGVAFALWRFARHLGLSPPVAVGSALLFLLYFPGAEVAIRFNAFPESLSALLLLLAAIFYIRALSLNSFWFYLLTITFCTASSLTKVSAIVFLPMLFLLAIYAQRNPDKLEHYSLWRNWGTLAISSIIFVFVFVLNTQVQTLQWQSVQGTMSGSWFDLLYIWIARPFMNFLPLNYPLPTETFTYNWTYYLVMAGGIILAVIAYWRICKGDWVEKSLWILLYASLIHTLFLSPDARYQYMCGIPATLLMARYAESLWRSIKLVMMRLLLVAVFVGIYAVMQVTNTTAIASESRTFAETSRQTQKWAFDAMQTKIRHPYEKALLAKKEFIPTDHFLSQIYLYPPYRAAVEEYYAVTLPTPESIGLPSVPTKVPMTEPTDWLKAEKKR